MEREEEMMNSNELYLFLEVLAENIRLKAKTPEEAAEIVSEYAEKLKKK